MTDIPARLSWRARLDHIPIYNDPHGYSVAHGATYCLEVMRGPEGPPPILSRMFAYAAINGAPTMNDLPDAHDQAIDAQREVRRLNAVVQDFVWACEEEVSCLEAERNNADSPGWRTFYDRRIAKLLKVLDRHDPTD